MTPGVLELAGDLAARGRTFALATVVWRRGPTSGKQGSKAVIFPDGSVRGWLAGACAEPTIIKEARAAMADGRPRLLFLGPSDELDGALRTGVMTVPLACESEGALEVYLEPNVPPPHVVVIGRAPAAITTAALAYSLGWRATIVDEEGSDEHPDEIPVVPELDLAGLGVNGATAVVVATQGHYDEAALEMALASPAGYVGLIASRKRADSVRDYLRERGLGNETITRVHAPAGLDLGELDPDEIGVAVLAELVSLKAAGELGPSAEPAPVFDEARDPVCGMVVDVARVRLRSQHEGRTYFFCSAGCRRKFDADPVKYAVG
ncbi:MAG TPA: XdhC family protein [Acidimicrobiia bacterium]|nr:XdhC family protein [Acidimicrobiia bacterium]